MYSARQVDTSPRVRRNPSLVCSVAPPLELTAETRGGPALAPALPQRGLTPRERASPHTACRGPPLLYRSRNGAPQSPRAQLERSVGDLYNSAGQPVQNRRLFLLDDDSKQESASHIRDGHLAEPLWQEETFLTAAERADPHTHCRGPSLLYRDKFNAGVSSHKFKVRDPSDTAVNRQIFLLPDGNYVEAEPHIRTDKLTPTKPWRGLTEEERADPKNRCRAPELAVEARRPRRPEYYVEEPCCMPQNRGR